MPRFARALVLTALIVGTLLPATGCGNKSDSTPNPDMGTPNIPPGRQAGEGAAPKDTKKK